MRRVLALVGLVVVPSLALACAGEEPRPTRGEAAEAPARPPPPRHEAPEQHVLEHPIDVAGVVAADLDRPLVRRSVVLVDARGGRHDLVTDGDGRFAVSGVLPPYDVAVTPAPSGPVTVHLGLRRSDPFVELFEPQGPAPAAEGEVVRVTVRAPPCDLPSCRVTVATASASGAGSASTTCMPDTTTIDVDHRWRGPVNPAGERIDVHVLVGDGDRSTFRYARAGGVVAASGGTVDVGVVEPMPVPATEPISIGVQGGAGPLVDWRWSTSVFLDLSGGALGPDTGTLFMVAAEAETSVRLPLVPGATIHASIAASHPRSDGDGGFERSTEVWSGGRALSVDPIVLPIAPGPETVRPAASGILSQRALGFEWRSLGIAALSTLTVVDTTRGGIRFRVVTTGQEVPFARLAGLGVSELDVGEHVLDLSTSPGIGADDAVSPDPSVRRRRGDRARPGMATSLRVPFQVTK